MPSIMPALRPARPQRIPALEPALAPPRSSLQEVRERERQRPGFSFSSRDLRSDFAAVYPELDALCVELGLERTASPDTGCRDPRQALLRLARCAQPLLSYSITSAKAPIPELVAVLRDKQHQAIRCEMARLDLIIGHLDSTHNRMELHALKSRWDIFRVGLLEHMQEEELGCFPFCVRLTGAKPAELPSMQECMLIISRMNDTHQRTSEEMDEVMVLANRADFAVIDPDLAIIETGLDNLLMALTIHSELESDCLLPRCVEIVFKSLGQTAR